MSESPTVAGSLTFLLGKLGGLAGSRFAEKLAPSGLKPRHCAVLELAGSTPLSQLDLATRIGVTPSVVVDMLDELETLGAIRRVPQEGDRRRRIIELTPTGRTLHHLAAQAAHEVDAELLHDIDHGLQRALQSSLAEIASRHGFNYT